MAWTTIEPYSDRGADPAFRVSDADAILANLEALAAAVSVRSLGGSDVASPGLTDQWVDVIGAREQLLSTATAGLVRQAVVWSRTTDAGTSVTWRIVREDDEATVLVTGTPHTQTTRQREIVAIAVPTNGHRWKLQQRAGNAAAECFVDGQLEEYVL